MSEHGGMTMSVPKSTLTRAAFRPFFLLAGLDAILGVTVWLPLAFIAQATSVIGVPTAIWHRNALLFGTVPAILAGFLLTALPRWTGRPAISPFALRCLLALWLAMRVTSLAPWPAAGLMTAALFILALAFIAGDNVVRARDHRNMKVVMLLLLFWVGAMMTAGDLATDPALRLSLASIIGLLIVIGGRIVPALTTAYLQVSDSASANLRAGLARVVEGVSATTATVALGAWVVAPEAGLTGYACALASCGQLARVVQWRGWTIYAWPSGLVLHVAYGWIIVGFALLAVHILQPESLGRNAAVHAWTVGAFGSMSLAIMASMIRRHSGCAFVSSRLMTLAYVSITGACVSRLLPELFAAPARSAMALSAIFWIAAFGLFLAAFRHVLLPDFADGHAKSCRK